MTRIFIGSSSEAIPIAEDIYAVVKELAKELAITVEPRLWEGHGQFRNGSTIIESIEQIGANHGAAILVASPDDKTVKRGNEQWEPRDSVIFESGYFMARYGRRRVALVRVGNAALPTEVNGLVYQQVDPPKRSAKTGDYDHKDFRLLLKDKLRDWMLSLADPPSGDRAAGASTLIADTWQRLQKQSAWGRDYEVVACEVLEQLASSLEPGEIKNQGINHDLINRLSENLLASADSICAIDVLGPPGWLSPISFRYLSVQIKEYIRRNLAGDRWNIRVSKRLATAMRRAVALCPSESLTMFDESDRGREDHGGREVYWTEADPALEFCRVLLWSKEELLTRVAESVIAIHEAFHVPLFFVETPWNHPSRTVDYIYFASRGSVIDGFYGLRKDEYMTHSFLAKAKIPGIADPAANYWSIVESNPEFAVDARQRLLSK